MAIAGCGGAEAIHPVAGSTTKPEPAANDGGVHMPAGRSEPRAGPKCSSAPTQLVDSSHLLALDSGFTGGISVAIDLAVNDTDVFYALNTGSTTPPGKLMRVPIHGGAPVFLEEIHGDERALLVTPDAVVVALAATLSDGVEQFIMKMPLDGSELRLFPVGGGDFSGNVVTDGRKVYFSDRDGTRSLDLADGHTDTLTEMSGVLGLVGSTLFIGDRVGGDVFSIPAVGGGSTTVATGQQGIAQVLGCGAGVCWLNEVAGLPLGSPPGSISVAGEGNGTLVQLAPGGSPVVLSRDPDLFSVWRIVFDGSTFFASVIGDASPGIIEKIPAGGGKPIVLGGAGGLAIDNDCLYVASFPWGLYSMAKSFAGGFP